MVTNNKQTELTGRQALFAKEYLVDYNATQAALRAHYAESGAGTEGSRLLQNAAVKAEITRLEQLRDAEQRLDQAYIKSKIVHFIENADQDAVALRAVELGGKTLRMFVDVSENTVTHDVQALQEFTIEQLAAMREQASLRAPEPVEDVIDVDSREVTD